MRKNTKITYRLMLKAKGLAGYKDGVLHIYNLERLQMYVASDLGADYQSARKALVGCYSFNDKRVKAALLLHKYALDMKAETAAGGLMVFYKIGDLAHKGSKMIISVRPNLNNKDQCSIHEGRLGRVLEHRARLSFVCSGAVVRPSGIKAAQSGNKYPHAALIGTELDFIEPSVNAPLIRFNPLVDTDFHIDGAALVFPCIVSVIGWRFYLVG